MVVLIVWGARVRVGGGRAVTLACPRCGADRAGVHGRARRWFTVLGVPVVPLRPLGEVVTCAGCQARFDAAVLERPTNATMISALADAVRLLVVAVLRAGDGVTEASLQAGVALVARTRPGYDTARLETDLEHVDLARVPLLVRPLAAGLSVEGKENLVAGLVRTALAAGPVGDGRRATVHAVGAALGLTPLHVDGILAVMGAGQPARRDDLPPPA
ncbi:MAG: hypothetical protein U0Q15_00855 [Kineosporiaceae bacterium]